MEILLVSEHKSSIEYPDDEIRESKNHHHRESDISIGMYRAIIPEHDSDICEIPPESKRQYRETDICDEESDISEWF